MIDVIEPKVKLKRKGGFSEVEFSQAKALLTDFPKAFSIAEPKKYEFKNGELIKKPKKADTQ